MLDNDLEQKKKWDRWEIGVKRASVSRTGVSWVGMSRAVMMESRVNRAGVSWLSVTKSSMNREDVKETVWAGLTMSKEGIKKTSGSRACVSRVCEAKPGVSLISEQRGCEHGRCEQDMSRKSVSCANIRRQMWAEKVMSTREQYGKEFLSLDLTQRQDSPYKKGWMSLFLLKVLPWWSGRRLWLPHLCSLPFQAHLKLLSMGLER